MKFSVFGRSKRTSLIIVLSVLSIVIFAIVIIIYFNVKADVAWRTNRPNRLYVLAGSVLDQKVLESASSYQVESNCINETLTSNNRSDCFSLTGVKGTKCNIKIKEYKAPDQLITIQEKNIVMPDADSDITQFSKNNLIFWANPVYEIPRTTDYKTLKIKVISSKDSKPVAGATVTVRPSTRCFVCGGSGIAGATNQPPGPYLNFGEGVPLKTNANGEVDVNASQLSALNNKKEYFSGSVTLKSYDLESGSEILEFGVEKEGYYFYWGCEGIPAKGQKKVIEISPKNPLMGDFGSDGLRR